MSENLIEIDWSQIQNQSGKNPVDLKNPLLLGAVQAMIRADKKTKKLEIAGYNQSPAKAFENLLRLPLDGFSNRQDDAPQIREDLI